VRRRTQRTPLPTGLTTKVFTINPHDVDTTRVFARLSTCRATPHDVHTTKVFTARCYASAVLAMALCPSVRPSVCLSVCPSQVGVLLKRLYVGSHKQHDSCFLMPKISAKFDRGHPLRGRRMQVGWVKIGDFRQIAGYIISKTVQDRHIVSIKVE